MVKLVPPSVDFQESFLAAVREFQAEGRNQEYSLTELERDFSGFVMKLHNMARGLDVKPGYVPMTTLWLVNGREYLGRVSIRHQLTEELRREGGHIGYEIRPTQRKRGYGTKILELALPVAKQLGLHDVLITCDLHNIGSRKIIEKNGGVQQDVIEVAGQQKRRFVIREHIAAEQK